jgi:hypothetical protein
VSFIEKDCLVSNLNKDGLRSEFEMFGFNSLLKRLAIFNQNKIQKIEKKEQEESQMSLL